MPEPEKKEETKPDPVMDVLNELNKKVEELQKPAEKKPEASQVPDWKVQREAERKALGFTEEQMNAHERTIARAQAPIIERTAWSSIDKKPEIETLRKEIEEELRIYRPEQKTPELMEKIYYMVRGKHADSKPAGTASKGSKVETTRVSGGPGYTGQEPGMSGGREESATANEELDDREKFVVSKLQESGVEITEKEYAKSRNVGRGIRELRIPDARPVTSMADVELRRLQKR